MGVKALIYFEVVTTLALFIGWAAITISRAGEGITLPPPSEGAQIQQTARRAPGRTSCSTSSRRTSRARSSKARCCRSSSSACSSASRWRCCPTTSGGRCWPSPKASPRRCSASRASSCCMAPIGVGAAIAYTVGQLGLGMLVNLLKLLATFYVAVGGVRRWSCCCRWRSSRGCRCAASSQAVAEPVSIAFATTSSEAALPRAMEAMERLGVPRQIVAFVMPTGYSFNLDGSTLYLSLSAIFVAQAAGIELSVGQQFVLLLTLMLTSKGVAGVPRGALVILLGTVASFGLPVEPVFMILGIDALLDMLRTSLNVLGNCLATVVIARWEGEYKD